MRAEKQVGCVMNERRKHQGECGADESMHVHSEQRRSFQSKSFHESTLCTLLPPRPRSYGDTGLSSRGSELLGLQVQGFCCPLQQRASSGRITHRVTPQSRRGGDGSLTLPSSLKGRVESRAKPASRSRTGGRPEMTPEGGAPTVCHHRDPVSETAETPTTPSDSERQAHHRQPDATKVAELHLYLPSSIFDDEEQDAETEEMSRLSLKDSRSNLTIKNILCLPTLHTPAKTSPTQDPTLHGTPSDDLTSEDFEHSCKV